MFLKSKNSADLSDQDLIFRYKKKNDPEVLGQLYSRYVALVYGLCLKYLDDREHSKDATMQIFELLATELKRHDISNFKSWLYVLSKNFCLMELRKQKSLRKKEEVWLIHQEDFMENPPKGFYRLCPDGEVRLRHAYIIKCEQVIKDEKGEIVELRCTYEPSTKSGQDNSGKKVKGTIHWVSATHAANVEVHLYDRLFKTEMQENMDTDISEDSLKILSNCYIEPSALKSPAGSRFQFERLGYFYLDPVEYEQGKVVFNRIVTLRDSWSKILKKQGE